MGSVYECPGNEYISDEDKGHDDCQCEEEVIPAMHIYIWGERDCGARVGLTINNNVHVTLVDIVCNPARGSSSCCNGLNDCYKSCSNV